jgi:hypothetical protein
VLLELALELGLVEAFGGKKYEKTRGRTMASTIGPVQNSPYYSKVAETSLASTVPLVGPATVPRIDTGWWTRASLAYSLSTRILEAVTID